MPEFERYAVFFTPEGALADAGAAWLGWDVATGHEVKHPQLAGIDLQRLTAKPRTYGLHGTLKPPFVLALGSRVEGLQAAVDDLAASLAPVTLEGLEIAALGPFLALKPQGDQTALSALAAQVVMQLDPFRAPLSEAELNRRRQSRLNAVQEAHLQKWGYPYVMDAFRFHITLTGRTSRAEEAQVLPVARSYFAPYLSGPMQIDSLTLVGQGRDGMFRQIERFRL